MSQHCTCHVSLITFQNHDAARRTPQLHFPRYFIITFSLLAVAGVAIHLFSRWSGRDTRTVWLTYKSWLVMVPLIALAAFLGRWAVVGGAVLLAIFAFKEFARATGVYRDWWMTGAAYLASSPSASPAGPRPDHAPGWYGLFTAMPATCHQPAGDHPGLRNSPRDNSRSLALAIVGFMYIGWMFGHVAFLANCATPTATCCSCWSRRNQRRRRLHLGKLLAAALCAATSARARPGRARSARPASPWSSPGFCDFRSLIFRRSN